MKDIETREEVEFLVDSFYDKAKEDEKLAPVFDKYIGDKWDEHMEKLYRFWATIILREESYTKSAFEHHKTMSLDKEHFEIWNNLFVDTVNELFKGEKANRAKFYADCMTKHFRGRLGI